MKHAPSRLQYCSAKPCNSRNWWMWQLILLCTRNCNKTKRSLERTKILKELDLYLLFLQLKTLVLMHPRQLLYHFNQLEGGGGEGLHRTLWCMCANVGKIEEREIQFGKNGRNSRYRSEPEPGKQDSASREYNLMIHKGANAKWNNSPRCNTLPLQWEFIMLGT